MMSSRRSFCQCFLASFAGASARPALDKQVSFHVIDDWTVKVDVPDVGVSGVVHVTPPVMVRVTAEPYRAIPLFNPKVGGWLRGAQLTGVKAQETTSPRLLDPNSFQLRSGPTLEAPLLRRNVDYDIDTEWGTFGRLPGGAISADQSVFATYSHAQMRVDAVVLTRDRQIRIR